MPASPSNKNKTDYARFATGIYNHRKILCLFHDVGLDFKFCFAFEVLPKHRKCQMALKLSLQKLEDLAAFVDESASSSEGGKKNREVEKKPSPVWHQMTKTLESH